MAILKIGAVLLLLIAAVMGLINGRYMLGRNLTDSLPGDWFIVDLTARSGPYTRGSVVAFAYDGRRWDYSDSLLWIKKIAGLPGDRISVVGTQVLVDEMSVGKINTGIMRRGELDLTEARKVPAGHLFVIGDSQSSLDSRYAQFGFVPLAALQGLVWRLK